jgi:hypothetical protein
MSYSELLKSAHKGDIDAIASLVQHNIERSPKHNSQNEWETSEGDGSVKLFKIAIF